MRISTMIRFVPGEAPNDRLANESGLVPVHPAVDSIPVEQLMPKQSSGAPPTAFQMIPVVQQQEAPPPPVNPGVAPPPIPRTGGGK